MDMRSRIIAYFLISILNKTIRNHYTNQSHEICKDK